MKNRERSWGSQGRLSASCQTQPKLTRHDSWKGSGVLHCCAPAAEQPAHRKNSGLEWRLCQGPVTLRSSQCFLCGWRKCLIWMRLLAKADRKRPGSQQLFPIYCIEGSADGRVCWFSLTVCQRGKKPKVKTPKTERASSQAYLLHAERLKVGACTRRTRFMELARGTCTRCVRPHVRADPLQPHPSLPETKSCPGKLASAT